MIRTLRRAFVCSMGHGFKFLAAFLLLAWGTTFLVPGPAEADEETDKWKQVALSDVGVNQRLMALEALKKVGSDAATGALADVAAAGERSVARSRGANWKGGLRSISRRAPIGRGPGRKESQRPACRDDASRSGRKGGGEGRP